MTKKPKYEESSGNIFTDLKLTDSEETLAKSDVAVQISKIIKLKKLTQKEAAKLIGVDQPKISSIIRGKIKSFSLERLIRFLQKLGENINIVIESKQPQPEYTNFPNSIIEQLDKNLLTKRQLWLYQKLSGYKIDNETYTLGEIFIEGIKILNSKQTHKFVFCAHNCREIIEKFPKIIIKKDRLQGLNSLCQNIVDHWINVTKSKNWKTKEYSEKTIDKCLSNFLVKFDAFSTKFRDINPKRNKRISDTINATSSSFQKLSQEHLVKVADMWLDLNDFFQAVAHHGRIVDQREFDENLEKFEVLFFELLKPKTFEDHHEIDDIIFLIENTNISISKKLSQKLILKLSKPSNFNYFFENLNSSKWIKILINLNSEILKKPFDPIITEEGTIYPTWPVSQYLLRIVEKEPVLIANLIKEVLPSKNFRIHIDFIDCALKMPEQQCIEIGKLALGWIRECQYEKIPKKCIVLAVKLASFGKHWLSQNLIEEVLQIEKNNSCNEAVSKVDLHKFQNILKNDLVNLLDIMGERVIFSLVKSLNKVLKIEDDIRPPDQDLSYIWRPQIKDNTHLVNQYSCKNLLINSLIDYSLKLIYKNPKKANELIDYFFNFNIGVYHRIGVCLSSLDGVEIGIVRNILLNKVYYKQESTWAEFHFLLNKCFIFLSPSEQKSIYDIILNECDSKNNAVWQYRALSAIKDHLPENLATIYLELDSIYNSLTGNIIAPSYSWVGPTSPLTEDEFNHLEIKDLFIFLESWEPSEDPFGPSREGLSRQLSERIKKEPDLFINGITTIELKKLHPVILTGIVRGFVETQSILKWHHILNLCINMLNSFSITEKSTPTNNEEPIEWVVIEILQLLQKGLISSAQLIPFHKRNRVWKVIKMASKFIYHREKEEMRYLEKSNDYYIYAISTAEGKTLDTVFYYALWVRNNLSEQEQLQGIKAITETEEVLIDFLDSNTVSQISIYGVYGRWFPWLVLIDNNFANQLSGKIFTRECPRRYEAAWQSYLLSCRAYDTTFEIIVNEYRLFLGNLKHTDNESSLRNIEIERRFCEHLMELFYRKKIFLNSPDHLIQDLLELTDIELIEHSIQKLGKFMIKTDIRSFQNECHHNIMIEFWNFSINHKNESVQQSLQQFGYWFIAEKLPFEWSIDNLMLVLEKVGSIEPEKRVLDTITKHVKTDPKRCLDFACSYFQKCIRKKLHWFYQDEFHELLSMVKSNIKTPYERSTLSDLIHLMGEAGYSQFKDLIG